MPQLLEVTHVSRRGSSLRITLPKMVGEKLGISPGDVVGFYEEDGKIMIQKMK
jgi:AbrB family looped-hinge helix DNA binding protein